MRPSELKKDSRASDVVDQPHSFAETSQMLQIGQTGAIIHGPTAPQQAPFVPEISSQNQYLRSATTQSQGMRSAVPTSMEAQDARVIDLKEPLVEHTPIHPAEPMSFIPRHDSRSGSNAPTAFFRPTYEQQQEGAQHAKVQTQQSSPTSFYYPQPQPQPHVQQPIPPASDAILMNFSQSAPTHFPPSFVQPPNSQYQEQYQPQNQSTSFSKPHCPPTTTMSITEEIEEDFGFGNVKSKHSPVTEEQTSERTTANTGVIS